jgi:hypothetical protein
LNSFDSYPEIYANKIFFLSLLQAKGAFLRPARDVVEYGCGLPYPHPKDKVTENSCKTVGFKTPHLPTTQKFIYD